MLLGKETGHAEFEKHVQFYCQYDESVSEEKGEKFDSDKVKRLMALLGEAKVTAKPAGGKDFRAFMKAQKKKAMTQDNDDVMVKDPAPEGIKE